MSTVTTKRIGDDIEVCGLVQTIQELLTKAEIPFDETEDGEVLPRHYTLEYVKPNAWPAQVQGGGAIQLFQIKAVLKRKPATAPEFIKDRILEELRDAAPAVPVRRIRPSRARDALLMEFSVFDLHLGKIGFGEEWGVDGARDAWWRVVDGVKSQCRGMQFHSIVFPIGNDFLNVDTIGRTTTAGTPQSVSDELWELAKQGRRLLQETIIDFSESFRCPIRVVAVPGNHDWTSTIFLGEILDARFHANPNVTVDTSKSMRKYHRFGDVLLGFTHGKEEKWAELPLKMAEEFPEWSETRFREWHLGHRHKVKTEEFGSVRVKHLPSLSPSDLWHHQKGYGALRSAEVYLWHRNEGERGRLVFNHLSKAA